MTAPDFSPLCGPAARQNREPIAASGPSFLVLVGTVHRDPEGYRRLLRLLEEERPDQITAEISPYSLVRRAREAGRWRKRVRENLRQIQEEEGWPARRILGHGEIQAVFSFLQTPYEWRAIETYARPRRIHFWAIDLSSFSREHLSLLPEILEMENLRRLLNRSGEDPGEEAKRHYRRARFLLRHPPAVWPAQPGSAEREDHMARRIRQIAGRTGNRKILHVGGWEHLLSLPGRPSLFDRLRDLEPRAVLLAESAPEEDPERLTAANF